MAHPRKIGCKIEGCEAGHRRNGFCARHDAQFKSGAIDADGRVLRELRPIVSPDHPLYAPRQKAPCRALSCSALGQVHGFCRRHLYHWRTGKLSDDGVWLQQPRGGNYRTNPSICKMPGCGDAEIKGHGFCDRHYQQYRKGIIDTEGNQLRELKIGKGKAKYDGRYVDRHGYVHILLPDHPMANCEGYVLEHRLVVAKMLGRCLTAQEIVHHHNGKRADNAPENLELMRRFDHFPGHSVYAEDVVAYAADILSVNGMHDPQAFKAALDRLNTIALTLQV